MSRVVRILFVVFGMILVAFGLGCLNYTKADGLQHHLEAAARLNLPQPSESILFGGAGALILGAGMIGLAIGRRAA